MRKRNNRNKTQAVENTRCFMAYYDWLKNIALSEFEWLRLPDSMDERFLEIALYQNGKALIAPDKKYKTGIINLRATPNGRMNIYENFVRYKGYSIQYDAMYDADECVYVRNNRTTTPTDLYITMWAERLAKIEIAIQSNISVQRFPIIAKTTDTQRMSMENMLEKFEGGVPFIISDKSFDEFNDLTVFNTAVPLIAPQLFDLKKKTFNDCLSFLGINNANNEKANRMIVDEVNANNENIGMSCASFYEQRKLACEQANKMFGLNIDVRKRDVSEVLQMTGGNYDNNTATQQDDT
mgnify:CR=1 FL=1